MPVDVPHEQIREGADRSWTERLIEYARDPALDDDEREAVLITIGELDDHRAVGPLRAMVEDPSLSARTRDDVSSALVSIDCTTTPALRREWFASGDEPLMAHALAMFERTEGDLLIPVADDDAHPLKADALLSMEVGFGEAAYMPILIDALHHPDGRVRWAAARTLVWQEPVAAHDALIRVLDDPDEDVVDAALHVLEWSHSRRVLAALQDFDPGESEMLNERLERTLTGLRSEFERLRTDHDGNEQALEALRAWIEPVAGLIQWPDEIEPPEPSERSAKPLKRRTVEEVRAIVDDVDGSWAGRADALHVTDWEPFTTAERALLTPLLSEDVDPDIRRFACRALGAWGNTERLLELADDPSAVVRHAAVSGLKTVPLDPRARAAAWAALAVESDDAAAQALDAVVAHTPRDVIGAVLERLFWEDPRVEVRLAAVDALQRLKAIEEIARLAAFLDQPPYVTWTLHVGVLHAMLEVDLSVAPTTLERLAEVDDTWLQSKVVECQFPE